ncbi:unnamed protein product [Adineta ricciae]|uniref:F-box domain-containing protein n=1 Tax=Adineta ricciae TaxID=249248 RepID=A0A814UTK1_ADIRI|nr:unnamed protein product [Adineta ricciae]
MNDENSDESSNERTQLECFPVEIFYLIFEYLTGNEILQSFGDLNHHFGSLLKNLRLNTIDLSSHSRQEILNFFKTSYDFISCSTPSIKFSNHQSQPDSCSANIELVFSLLLDHHRLRYLCQTLQQIIFIRPIIDTKISLPNTLLQSFLIYSFEDKIIFRKSHYRNRIDCITICDINSLRLALADHGGMYNQILIDCHNPVLHTFLPFVRHLKISIHDYSRQWTYMSQFITNTLEEITVIIVDDRFEDYHGESFSTLFSSLSDTCRLHFYLKFKSSLVLRQTDADILVQSFRTEFYVQHRSNVLIYFCGGWLGNIHDDTVSIFTDPCCTSTFSWISQGEMIGTCLDYTNVNQLTLDFCNRIPTTPLSTSHLPNLKSLQLVHRAQSPLHRWLLPRHNLFEGTTTRIRHLHFLNAECLEYFLKKATLCHAFRHIRYLDITDTNVNCAILCRLLEEKQVIMNIYHLNIASSCPLRIKDIKSISKNCSTLQTLQFSMELLSSFIEQLNAIGEHILIHMRSHLHYVHVRFDAKPLTNSSVLPSEMQLSDWLGENQNRLSHLQAIELTRKELFVWL